MRIAVVGSRNYTNYEEFKILLLEELYSINKILSSSPNGIEYVSGGASGVDSMARKFALENELPIKEFLPKWVTYGKQAGFLRNLKIVEYADIGIAFWDGKSKGTKHSIDSFQKANKKVFVIRTDKIG